MLIKPRVRGFVCVTAHPAGCAANVRSQIEHVRAGGPISGGPKRVLVLGASTGYGLASRTTAAFGCGAATIGVFFEKPGLADKPGTAGWYNSAAFHREAAKAGLYAKSVNGDAFSDEVKQRVVDTIRADLGAVDLVVYSLAAPKRTDPTTGVTYASVLKPIGKEVTLAGIDTDKGVMKQVTLGPATAEEIADTLKVMGGEDWERWIDALDGAGVLAPGAHTTAFTYLGDRLTWDIYWHGTIGAAKKDLDQRVLSLRDRLAASGGDARVSVLKAVVTQASSAIPVMPLYLSLLRKVLAERGADEGPIEQVDRLFRECLYGASPRLDDEGRYRVDDRELDPEVQAAVAELWSQVTDDTLTTLTDFVGYQAEFLRLFGFGVDGVEETLDVDPDVPIDELVRLP